MNEEYLEENWKMFFFNCPVKYFKKVTKITLSCYQTCILVWRSVLFPCLPRFFHAIYLVLFCTKLFKENALARSNLFYTSLATHME